MKVSLRERRETPPPHEKSQQPLPSPCHTQPPDHTAPRTYRTDAADPKPRPTRSSQSPRKPEHTTATLNSLRALHGAFSTAKAPSFSGLLTGTFTLSCRRTASANPLANSVNDLSSPAQGFLRNVPSMHRNSQCARFPGAQRTRRVFRLPVVRSCGLANGTEKPGIRRGWVDV